MAPVPSSALVIRLSSLGDVVLTTPVFAALKRMNPPPRTALLVRKAFAPVLAGHPDVDDLLVFEDRDFGEWVREIRRGEYDWIVDLHDTPRSRVLSLLGGARRRFRYDKRTWARRRLVWTKTDSPALSSGVVDRYLEPFDKIGLVTAPRVPRLYPDPALPAALEERLGPGPYVAVAPGAAHPTKRWPADRFAEAATRVAAALGADGERRPAVVLLGSRGDRRATQAVRRAFADDVHDLAGETGLREMMTVLNRSAVLLTNDSGAMHVAAALDVPTVAVFGPTVRAFGFFPMGRSRVIEVSGLACRPCSLHGGERCPRRHFRCMEDIPSVRVVDEALALLKNGGPRAREGGAP